MTRAPVVPHPLLLACLCCLCLAPSPARADLLGQFAHNVGAVRSLSCDFTQDKHMAFLPRPLRSEGRLAFERERGGAPALLWEYAAPTPSGFWHAHGQNWLWVSDRATLHRATGQEDRVLLAVLQHILRWFTVQPHRLREQYAVTEEPADACLVFTPRHEGFFTRLRVCLHEDLRSLRSLHITERNGDSTSLTFSVPTVNGAPLTTFPDGTPLP